MAVVVRPPLDLLSSFVPVCPLLSVSARQLLHQPVSTIYNRLRICFFCVVLHLVFIYFPTPLIHASPRRIRLVLQAFCVLLFPRRRSAPPLRQSLHGSYFLTKVGNPTSSDQPSSLPEIKIQLSARGESTTQSGTFFR